MEKPLGLGKNLKSILTLEQLCNISAALHDPKSKWEPKKLVSMAEELWEFAADRIYMRLLTEKASQQIASFKLKEYEQLMLTFPQKWPSTLNVFLARVVDGKTSADKMKNFRDCLTFCLDMVDKSDVGFVQSGIREKPNTKNPPIGASEHISMLRERGFDESEWIEEAQRYLHNRATVKRTRLQARASKGGKAKAKARAKK